MQRALAEDVGHGDLTTAAVVPPGTKARAVFVARERGVVAGLPVAELVFRCLTSDVEFRTLVPDGQEVAAGGVLAEVAGNARALLTGERTALNFLQRLSGIATLTARLAALVRPYGVRLADTRKTTPGLRVLEKYAVRVGGGYNHRFGLYDGVLIKDNHIRLAGGVRQAVARVRGCAPHTVRVEVEVEDLAQVAEALEAGADAILLDNMDPPTMAEAVRLVKGKCLVEASGGINEENIEAVAQTGVDVISVGALTHSARALDISMEIQGWSEA